MFDACITIFDYLTKVIVPINLSTSKLKNEKTNVAFLTIEIFRIHVCFCLVSNQTEALPCFKSKRS